jgi:hypothetical protein
MAWTTAILYSQNCIEEVLAVKKKKENRGKPVFEGKQDLAIEPFVQTQD